MRETRIGRRRLLITGGAGMALVAGCTGSGEELRGDDAGGEASEASATGTFRLLISDRPSAIDHFESLDVTFDEARVFQSNGSDVEEEEADAENEEENDEADDQDDGVDDEENGEDDVTDDDGDDEEENGDENNGDDEESENDDNDQQGFVVFNLDSPTVDLTEVIGERAISVFEGELATGRYTKIELSVEKVEGVLADGVNGNSNAAGNGNADAAGTGDNGHENDENGEDGDQDFADVNVPSERLQIIKPFEVTEGEEVSFVFDINVVERGQAGGYNLLPVIGESGVAGEDVEVEEVDQGDDEDSEEADEDVEQGDDDNPDGAADGEDDDTSESDE